MKSAGHEKFKKHPSIRSKVYFIFGAVIVIATGLVFAKSTERALYVRSVSSSEFNQYVITHHIGNAAETSDFSGVEGDFCVLHLSHPLPQARIQQSVVDWLYHYHDLDGGTNLTVDYRSPVTHKTTVLADAVYNHDTQTVLINIRDASKPGMVKVHVNWVDGWYGN